MECNMNNAAVSLEEHTPTVIGETTETDSIIDSSNISNPENLGETLTATTESNVNTMMTTGVPAQLMSNQNMITNLQQPVVDMETSNLNTPQIEQQQSPKNETFMSRVLKINKGKKSDNLSKTSKKKKGRPVRHHRPADCAHGNRIEHARGVCYQCSSNISNRERALSKSQKMSRSVADGIEVAVGDSMVEGENLEDIFDIKKSEVKRKTPGNMGNKKIISKKDKITHSENNKRTPTQEQQYNIDDDAEHKQGVSLKKKSKISDFMIKKSDPTRDDGVIDPVPTKQPKKSARKPSSKNKNSDYQGLTKSKRKRELNSTSSTLDERPTKQQKKKHHQKLSSNIDTDDDDDDDDGVYTIDNDKDGVIFVTYAKKGGRSSKAKMLLNMDTNPGNCSLSDENSSDIENSDSYDSDNSSSSVMKNARSMQKHVIYAKKARSNEHYRAKKSKKNVSYDEFKKWTKWIAQTTKTQISNASNNNSPISTTTYNNNIPSSIIDTPPPPQQPQPTTQINEIPQNITPVSNVIYPTLLDNNINTLRSSQLISTITTPPPPPPPPKFVYYNISDPCISQEPFYSHIPCRIPHDMNQLFRIGDLSARRVQLEKGGFQLVIPINTSEDVVEAVKMCQQQMRQREQIAVPGANFMVSQQISYNPSMSTWSK